MRLTKPRIFETKIYKSNRERFPKLVKRMGVPSPGDYNVENSFNRTQCNNRSYQFEKGARKTFTDDAAKSKQFIQCFGNYKLAEKAFDKLSVRLTTHSPRRR